MRLRRTILASIVVLAGLGAAPAVSQAYVTGIGDNNPNMFASPFFKALHTSITRFVAPYNVAGNPTQLAQITTWVRAAESEGIQPLIAFYHSPGTAGTHLPSVAAYTKSIKRFFKLFPEIKAYTPWNEANRGNVVVSGGASFHSPSAKLAAQYYLAMRSVCKGCKIVGLDVLDGQNIKPTIAYIRSFQRYAKAHLPTIWGLHNYSDTNRSRNTGTKAVLAAVRGQVWLTETGGLVKFGGAFPQSLSRAAKALTYMFKLAGSNRRIARLYIYNWYGGDSGTRFDAGLVDSTGLTPRPGYFVVRKKLTGH
ncbi:MAG: hypothetical protein ACR2KV_17875 [Solirubrobacteraceae bacterium]